MEVSKIIIQLYCCCIRKLKQPTGRVDFHEETQYVAAPIKHGLHGLSCKLIQISACIKQIRPPVVLCSRLPSGGNRSIILGKCLFLNNKEQCRMSLNLPKIIKRVRYFVLLNYSYKSWSIFKTRNRFGICWSWGFQNTPYMCNMTKFWLRYLGLKTYYTILLFSY